MAGSRAAAVSGRLEPVGGDGAYALSGTAGFATARQLLEQGRLAFAGKSKVELDLAGVDSIDSAGLALLLCWLAEARADGRALKLHNLPAQLSAIARISDVEALLADGIG